MVLSQRRRNGLLQQERGGARTASGLGFRPRASVGRSRVAYPRESALLVSILRQPRN